MMVLCGVSAYEKKYYLNPNFSQLPRQVKEELKIMCVTYVEEIGGIFTVGYSEDGTLLLQTQARDSDAMYDEVGSALRIKQLQEEKKEFFHSLELFYQVHLLAADLDGMTMDELAEKVTAKKSKADAGRGQA